MMYYEVLDDKVEFIKVVITQSSYVKTIYDVSKLRVNEEEVARCISQLKP